jgi:lysophospholipase L1-like esterase
MLRLGLRANIGKSSVSFKPINILIIGDSTVDGYTYANDVAVYFNDDSYFTVTDISEWGNDIAGQKAYYQALSSGVKTSVEAVFIQIGINDCYVDADSYATIKARYQDLITTINTGSPQAKIVACCILRCKGYIEGNTAAWSKKESLNADILAKNFTGIYKSTNAANDSLSDTNGYLLSTYSLLGDGVHENNDGRLQIANAWRAICGVVPIVKDVYETEATVLFNRMIAAGETPAGERKVIIDNTFKAAKGKSFYSKIDAVVTLAAHGTNSARMNWLGDEFNAVLSAVPPTFEIDRGFTGNGTSSYIKTSFNPYSAGSNFESTKASIGLYSRTNIDLEIGDMTAMVGSGGISLDIRYGDELYFRLNNTSAGAKSNNSSIGFFSVTREHTSNYVRYAKDGYKVQENQINPEAVNDVEIWVGARNVSGSPVYYTTKQYSFYFIGGELTENEVLDLYNVFVVGYLDSIGAKV